jgi:triosephosphate isomerase
MRDLRQEDHMRTKFIAGNWKMFTNAASARELASEVVRGLGGEKRVAVAVCPPFPYLGIVAEALRGSPVMLGAQDCFYEKEGAFTGEVSPWMLTDVGCRWVIIGHSERRHKLCENDGFINRKVLAALNAGLHVILCLGETQEERKAGQTENVLAIQLEGGLAALEASALSRLVLAYEPVWAIGTGVHATPEQAQQVHAFLRRRVRSRFGAAADDLIIQYGGSAKPENIASLLQQPDIDGALIGGASLHADLFLAIVRVALSKV